MSPFALVFTGSRHGSIEKPWVSNPAAVPARWRQCHQREAQKGRRRTQLLFSIFLSSFAKALLRNCHLVAEVYIEWKIHLLKAFDAIDVLNCTLVGVSRVGIEKFKKNRKGQQLHYYNRYQHLPCNLGVKKLPYLTFTACFILIDNNSLQHLIQTFKYFLLFYLFFISQLVPFWYVMATFHSSVHNRWNQVLWYRFSNTIV